MPPIKAIVFGAGVRGTLYANFALEYPDDLKIVGVAEPDTQRREAFAQQHGLDAKQCFTTWEDLLNAGKHADAVINATMDRMHYASTIAALEAGYDVLLEKPMTPILSENVSLIQTAEAQGRLLQVCHVLRYTPFFRTLRRIIDEGTLGRIISLDHRENLAYWHMAHSFVRGNWRNSDLSSPMILTKCCHDFDILQWLLRRKVLHLNSFGSLTHFTSENAPHPDVPLRCTDGCPVAETCKYDAQRFYGTDNPGWPHEVVTPIATREARLETLRTSPYGRCVYHCDNNVVDHQTVNLQYEDDITATLIMNGQGHEESRSIRIDGTNATLTGKFRDPYKINIYHHHTGKKETVPVEFIERSGHGGGDTGLMRGFVNALRGIPDDSLTTARESLESHLLAFAAEEARLKHTVIDMTAYRHHVEGLYR
ncbi:MAG: Gfo/Idh/MocA family oxidoreductase [Aggregatilineales bacterium]